MSYLPDFFRESWQAKQFSFRIGATSLMKLTGFAGCADAVCGEANSRYAARTADAQGVNRRRNMGGSRKKCERGRMREVYRTPDGGATAECRATEDRGKRSSYR